MIAGTEANGLHCLSGNAINAKSASVAGVVGDCDSLLLTVMQSASLASIA